MIIIGGSSNGVLTASNFCLLHVTQKKSQMWINLAFGIYGIGALVSPQIIRMIGLDTYHYISVFFLAFTILCYIYPVPHVYDEI